MQVHGSLDSGVYPVPVSVCSLQTNKQKKLMTTFLLITENDGMETFEIKLEVNGNQDSYYSMEPVDKSDQVVSHCFLTRGILPLPFALSVN